MEHHKSHNVFKSFIIVSCILLLIIFTLCLLFLIKKKQDNPLQIFAPDPNVKIGSIHTGDREQQIEDANNKGLVTFVLNSTPYFETGSSEGNINIENPPENQNRLICELKLNETGEVLYKSGYLDPGQYIDYIELDKNMPDGIHEATAYFYAYEIETNKYIGNVAAEVKLYIGNMG